MLWQHAQLLESVDADDDARMRLHEVAQAECSADAEVAGHFDVGSHEIGHRPLERELGFEGFLVQVRWLRKSPHAGGRVDGCFLAPALLSAETAAAWYVQGPCRTHPSGSALQAIACMPVDLQHPLRLRLSLHRAHAEYRARVVVLSRSHCSRGISLRGQLQAEYWHWLMLSCAYACGGSCSSPAVVGSSKEAQLLLNMPSTLVCSFICRDVVRWYVSRVSCFMTRFLLSPEAWTGAIIDATNGLRAVFEGILVLIHVLSPRLSKYQGASRCLQKDNVGSSLQEHESELVCTTRVWKRN